MQLGRSQEITRWRTAETAARYYFSLDAQPKERPRNDSTAVNTREWEALIADATREQCGFSENLHKEPPLGKEKPLGMRILYRLPALRGDIDNYLKSLSDAMQCIAYHNDSQFDYIEMVRTVYPRTLIEVELLR